MEWKEHVAWLAPIWRASPEINMPHASEANSYGTFDRPPSS
jgi:hypothetical protein